MKISSLVLAYFFVSTSQQVFADDALISVSAEVMPVCHIVSSTDMDFGQVYPDEGVDVSAQATVSYWCTKGLASAAISMTEGDHSGQKGSGKNMQSVENPGEYLAYTASYSLDGVPYGGPTVTNTLYIDGVINAADYQDSWVGLYTDTLLVSINGTGV